MHERPPGPRDNSKLEVIDIEDDLEGESREVRTLFKKLPRELWKRHFDKLRDLALEGGEDPALLARKKFEYLSKILEARKAGMEEYKSNHPSFHEMAEREFGAHLQALLESSEGMLGAGQTARVKHLSLPDGSPAAVKYLLTPTQKTLSAEGEHDMLYEVDTITKIEAEEQKHNAGQRIRVPHPYFFYKNDQLQCYGMQEIIGMTFAELLNADTPHTVELVERRDAITQALRERYADSVERESLFAELTSFANAMHEVCLHGDIKPGNLMADEKGDLYLIDFGQSVDANLMSDKTREQFENLQALEHHQLATTIRTLLHAINDASAMAN